MDAEPVDSVLEFVQTDNIRIQYIRFICFRIIDGNARMLFSQR